VSDTNLYGLNVEYRPDLYSLDVYYVRKDELHKDYNLSTAGLRISGKIPSVENLGLKLEYAKQFGDIGSADFKGCAGLVGVSYEIPTNMSPVISVNYNYYSGGKSTDSDVKFWVPVYPSNVADRIGKIAYPALFQGYLSTLPPAGLQVVNLGFALKPLDKLTMNLDWYNLRCVKTYSPGLKKAIGNEIDLGLTYNYTEDLAFGLDIGYLLKGKLIKQLAGRGVAASPFQAIASMKVAF